MAKRSRVTPGWSSSEIWIKLQRSDTPSTWPPELEFFYFKDHLGVEPLDSGGYFDLTPLDGATDLRRETVLTLEEMGIGVALSHHEAAPSQHEMDLRYTDALTMADNVMTYRIVVKEVAMQHNIHATFMPKPLVGDNGNGMHVH